MSDTRILALFLTLAGCSSQKPVCPEDQAALPRATEDPILLDGVPEIEAPLRQRVAQYLNTRSARLDALSDSGEAVLVTTRFGSTRQIHLVMSPLGMRRQLTYAENPVKGARFIKGETNAVLFLSDVGGNERYQIYRLNREDGTTALLTDGKSRHNMYALSHAGDRVAFSNNARNGKDMDLYISDGKTSSSIELFLPREGYWFPVEWSRDGTQLLIRHYVSISDSRIYVVDLATKKVTPISPESPRASYRSVTFGEQKGVFYVTTDREGEFVELFRVDLAQKSWAPLTRSIPWNVEEVILTADEQIVFVTNEGGYSVLYLLDTKTKKHAAISGIPRGMVFGLVGARTANVVGFTLMGAGRTGDAYSYDLARKKLVRWTESEVGGLNDERFVEPKLIEYETFDKKKIPAFYFEPQGKGPFPVVIRIHGGPEAQSRPYFSPLTQYLVSEAKVAVLVPNVRGSNGYGKTYLALDNGMKREDSVKDIGALIDWIEKQDELDQKRVAVYGGSYGGYMVLASLIHYGDRLKAGAEIVGISNFVTFLKNTSDYRRDLRRAEYGDERDPAMLEFLTAISPTKNVEKIKSALLVAQGLNDPRVPASESEQIVAAVRKTGHEVWYMLARNEGHGFRRKENRDTYVLLLAKFFETHL